MARKIFMIAKEIAKDWTNVNYAAVPYLNAMMTLSHMKDSYGADPANHIINYFLSNATQWRGDVARRIKKELNDMLKEYRKYSGC